MDPVLEVHWRGPAFLQPKTFLGKGLTQSLVAMKAQASSTRSVAKVFCQMIYPFFNPLQENDRLLDGPTNDVWIFPWVSMLMDMGSSSQAVDPR